jgi:hypothetical protein
MGSNCYYYFGKNLYTVKVHIDNIPDFTSSLNKSQEKIKQCFSSDLLFIVQIITRIPPLLLTIRKSFEKNNMDISKISEYEKKMVSFTEKNNDFGKKYKSLIFDQEKLKTKDIFLELNYIENIDIKIATIKTLLNDFIKDDPIQIKNSLLLLDKIKSYNEFIGSKIQHKKGFKGFFHPQEVSKTQLQSGKSTILKVLPQNKLVSRKNSNVLPRQSSVHANNNGYIEIAPNSNNNNNNNNTFSRKSSSSSSQSKSPSRSSSASSEYLEIFPAIVNNKPKTLKRHGAVKYNGKKVSNLAKQYERLALVQSVNAKTAKGK